MAEELPEPLRPDLEPAAAAGSETSEGEEPVAAPAESLFSAAFSAALLQPGELAPFIVAPPPVEPPAPAASILVVVPELAVNPLLPLETPSPAPAEPAHPPAGGAGAGSREPVEPPPVAPTEPSQPGDRVWSAPIPSSDPSRSAPHHHPGTAGQTQVPAPPTSFPIVAPDHLAEVTAATATPGPKPVTPVTPRVPTGPSQPTGRPKPTSPTAPMSRTGPAGASGPTGPGRPSPMAPGPAAAVSTTAPPASAEPTLRRRRRLRDPIGWWRRLRAVVGLVVTTVVLGVLLAAVLAAAVGAIVLAIQHALNG